MREVYRRTEVARWNGLIMLALAAASAIVIAIVGAPVHLVGVVIWPLVALADAALIAALTRPAANDATAEDRLVTAQAARARILLRFALFVPFLVAVVVGAGLATGEWTGVPGIFLISAGVAFGDGWRIRRWEADHPGERQVVPLTWRGRKGSVLRADA